MEKDNKGKLYIINGFPATNQDFREYLLLNQYLLIKETYSFSNKVKKAKS